MVEKKPTPKLVEPRAGRPNMPGYGVPRSRRGLLPWSWARERLEKSHNYVMITMQPGPQPHAMPVWGIWFEGKFYFSTGRQSRKAKNLSKNPRCTICNERIHEAVIVHGRAKEVTNPKLIERLGVPYHAKYKPWKLDPALGPVYAVTPRVAFGMYEKKFTAAATRWKF
jgi:Pyridoxamine 5'-phosphate oxidase